MSDEKHESTPNIANFRRTEKRRKTCNELQMARFLGLFKVISRHLYFAASTTGNCPWLWSGTGLD